MFKTGSMNLSFSPRPSKCTTSPSSAVHPLRGWHRKCQTRTRDVVATIRVSRETVFSGERTMSATGLKVFDTTLQTTNVWLDDVMRELGWDDRHKAYTALRTVLHALRDRLPVDNAAHFGAQLPMLVRGFYYEGWHPAHKPVKERSRDEFLMHITDAFLRDVEADSRQIANAVFKTLSKHMTAGEIEKIRQALPGDVREMWM
jgi:uncharacterized protein (DUF2267 family)